MEDLARPHRSNLVLQGFQDGIVKKMSARLRLTDRRPLLLRSPTGSGKTLMIGRVLNGTAEELRTMWLWFAPYSHLVTQTYDALSDHCGDLRPHLLATQRSYHHKAGDVLLSTAQLVASADQRRQIYNPKKEGVPSFSDVVARARAGDNRIGVVVDEAHIGADSETEFGRFCRELRPDRMILASATPKDPKLKRFLTAAGEEDFIAFSVGRDEVVDAGLNKRYVAAFVYRPNEDWQSLADLQRTVLKRAWIRHLDIKEKLLAADCPTVPLTLVQVANGDGTAREAHGYLTGECGVPAEKIGVYENEDRDSASLTRMANDPTIEALIFKEAAGTGFDAPRAFILASTKRVNDPDFATQFVGRIMRVDRHVRALALKRKPESIEPDLDTAFVYLADADAQAGYQQAVARARELQTAMGGEFERLITRTLADGSTVITNRPVSQPGLGLQRPEPGLHAGSGDAQSAAPDAGRTADAEPASAWSAPQETVRQDQEDLLAGLQMDPGVPRGPRPVRRPSSLGRAFAGWDALERACRERGLTLYRLREGLPGLPDRMLTEERPTVSDMGAVVNSVVRRFGMPQDLVVNALWSALGGVRGHELRTELTTGLRIGEQEVGFEIDRGRLNAEVFELLSALPQFEAADVRRLMAALGARLGHEASQFFDGLPIAARPVGARIERALRDAVCLLVRARQREVAEIVNDEIAGRVRPVAAKAAFPHALLFASDIPLPPSPKNAYGVVPPTEEQMKQLQAVLAPDDRRLLRDHPALAFPGGSTVALAAFDGAWEMNSDEIRFARALDQADWVLWWARNPDRKDYASGVVRSDLPRKFYPDFVLCVSFWAGDDPSIRLVETKHDTKDAANKSRRDPTTYGRVVFLTRNNGGLFIVGRDGSLGAEVGADLRVLREALLSTSGGARHDGP